MKNAVMVKKSQYEKNMIHTFFSFFSFHVCVLHEDSFISQVLISLSLSLTWGGKVCSQVSPLVLVPSWRFEAVSQVLQLKKKKQRNQRKVQVQVWVSAVSVSVGSCLFLPGGAETAAAAGLTWGINRLLIYLFIYLIYLWHSFMLFLSEFVSSASGGLTHVRTLCFVVQDKNYEVWNMALSKQENININIIIMFNMNHNKGAK